MVKRVIILTIALLFGSHSLFAQQETNEIPVRFSVGYGIYPIMNRITSSYSFRIDVKREQKTLPISFFVNSFHWQHPRSTSANLTITQIGIGYSRLSTKPKTWYFDPFVHFLFERGFVGSFYRHYAGLGASGGFQVGYRWKKTSLSCNIHSSVSYGKGHYPKTVFPLEKSELHWNYFFLFPTPMLNLSFTL